MRALDRAAQKGKPVVLLKVGNTEAGKRAAHSHTGAIVGSTKAYEAAFRQKGVVVARDIGQLIDFSMALASTALPRGKKVGIMTESGGGGVLLTERCAQLGLEVSEIHGSTLEKLTQVVPSLGSVKNPVDLTGQSLSNPALVKGALEVMFAAPDFDMLVPLLLMSKATAEQKARDLLKIVNQRKDIQKSLMVCWPEGPKQWIQWLMDKGIHVAVTPTRCACTLNALATYAEFLRHYESSQAAASTGLPNFPVDRKEKAFAVIHAAKQKGTNRLSEYEAKKLLAAYGIPVTEEVLAASLDEAVEAAGRIGYPVVAKVISEEIPHKTEAGVVALNINSPDALQQAYNQILEKAKANRPDAVLEGVLIQEMVSAQGVETIVGVSREDPFGPTIMFGLGGIFVEILKDVAIRILPVSQKDVQDMIQQIEGARILQGARGRKPADVAALAEVLLKTACLADELKGEIAELDINPLIILEDDRGAKAVDALVLLQ
jgi:acetyltransferase